MTARIAQMALDVADVDRQATFWSKALGLRSDLGGDGDGMPRIVFGALMDSRVQAGCVPCQLA